MFTQKIETTKKCEILLVGNELLIGKTRDYNSYWLGKQLTPFGISIVRTTIILDDVEMISDVLKEILAREPEFLFISGGLGPTFDDQTVQGIAKGLKKDLVLDDTALTWIKERYAQGHKLGIIANPELNESRIKMAYLPKGSKPLKNTMGSAPGILIFEHKTRIFILPGVPRELQAIFNEVIAPMLKEENPDIKFHESGFYVRQIGESTMAKKILEFMKEIDDRVWIKSHPRYKDEKTFVEMHISGYGDEKFEKVVMRAAKKVRKIILSLGGEIEEKNN
ncbi:MAG: molybdopterin-binding protein [Candidatus Hodarchaeota archaeon]